MKKRIISLLTAVALTASAAYAIAAQTDVHKEDTADALNELGLFLGTGNGYNLEGKLDRASSITLIVRMLGKVDEALENADDYVTPFVDVPEWAEPYVGYAYENNITKGTGTDTFSPDAEVTEATFLTLALRALGYKDSGENPQFVWNNPYDLAKEVELIAEDKSAAEEADGYFRADAVEVFWNALSADLADNSMTLADRLIAQDVFTADEYAVAKVIKEEGRDAVSADTTAEPEDTTAELEDTTAEPEDTTAEPEDTTAEPEDTTAEPEDTTAESEDTTATEDSLDIWYGENDLPWT